MPLTSAQPSAGRRAVLAIAFAAGATASYSLKPSVNDLPAPPASVEPGMRCQPFGRQLADGGFPELCTADPTWKGPAPVDHLAPPLSYFENREDGLYHCESFTDGGSACTRDQPPSPPPAKRPPVFKPIPHAPSRFR